MKKEAVFYERLEGDKVHCRLCNHHCIIAKGKFGFCSVRRNIDGTLYTMVFGEAIARNVDPVEKKPLYHFLRGSLSMSIATVGCNFHCGFCQNWQISQISQRQNETVFQGRWFPPEEVVEEAKRGYSVQVFPIPTRSRPYFLSMPMRPPLCPENRGFETYLSQMGTCPGRP
jgi:pyruvate formate lyase activating enzyme